MPHPSRPTVRACVAALALGLVAALLVAGPPAGTAAPQAERGSVRIQVLSNRAELVSGGDVLVRITAPRKAGRLRVTLDGRDVSRRFRHRSVVLLKGLDNGRNVLRARAGSARPDRVVITNHRNGGPVLSGPVAAAYDCQDTARDALCNEPATYSFLYKPVGRSALEPYDPAAPPSDVDTATTDQGRTVPFVVRREDGYQDRDRYAILTLFTPGRRWTAWKPQRQWNRKVLITHGGGCGASYAPAEPPLDDASGTLDAIPVPLLENSYVEALRRGFAVMSTALANTGHNCNVAHNAESLMMAKERLVEQYGTIRYTIGTGCSGGSVAQHTVANAYPGIYQGLVTTCSYPDVMSPGSQFADYHLMRGYFEDPASWGPGVLWSPTQIADVEGHLTPVNAITADEGLFKSAIDPEHACPGIPEPVAGDPRTRFDSETNPGGVRCDILTLMRNQLGPRPESVWSVQEQAAGRGFAGLPFGNSGVQYGLEALKGGRITPEQFADLNEKIGGLDVNADPIAARTAGDPASIANAYRTGLLNEFSNTSGVAMINHAGPDPGIAHDYAHAVWSHLRLQRSQGHTDNRVEWFGPTPLLGDVRWPTEAFIAMDRWLTRVEKDRRAVPLAQKVVEGRPASLQDRCLADGVPGVVCRADLATTNLSTPRQEAGGPAANDVLACRLQPLDRSTYRLPGGLPVPFTDAQWARLQAVFAGGVCDWARPGIGQRPARTWLEYGTARRATYGGAELPRAPKGSGLGWFGRSFRPLWRE
ncbi:hypothetical protein EXE59_04755 [Nocardioides eburneiflavus]|uniref:DUF6351 domain-containing protein n=1 Tax=Nocardioides eburneiflavus TaxID=2518372 RepID=A0A4Z1BPP5_9ACTN|nr:DUF6351 family protein [Nocardioides eburneiflavus]TGN63331.1 hypothetical protein EXE59_04755 [Nocardioides eburneiflavus]